MATVKLSAAALDDLRRIASFHASHGPDLATSVLDNLEEAILLLARHPFIGRPVTGERRELVISRARGGYVALYRFVETEDVALVLRIRHHREAGFSPS